MKCISIALFFLFLATSSLVSQDDKSKRPSPPGQAQCTFADGKKITIDYSRPSMKGRKVYGELVPWDDPWRTGANEATTFVTDTDVKVGGTLIPAGSYTLYSSPSQKRWLLIISKKTGQWGIPYPGNDHDLARVPMRSTVLPSNVEQFTITFDQKAKTCTLNLDWEQTRATVDIQQK